MASCVRNAQVSRYEVAITARSRANTHTLCALLRQSRNHCSPLQVAGMGDANGLYAMLYGCKGIVNLRNHTARYNTICFELGIDLWRDFCYYRCFVVRITQHACFLKAESQLHIASRLIASAIAIAVCDATVSAFVLSNAPSAL